MAYADLTNVRLLSGLTTDDISDDDINNLIPLADRQTLLDTTVRVTKELAQGDIDGSNKKFKVRFTEIADTNFDKVVDASDVKVYTGEIDSATGFMTYTEVTVSSVDKLNGIIELATAPASPVQEVRVDYSFTVPNIDYDLLTKAASLYCAYLAVTKLMTKDAGEESYSLGKLRIDKLSYTNALRAQAEKYYKEYLAIIRSFKPHYAYKIQGEGMNKLREISL